MEEKLRTPESEELVESLEPIPSSEGSKPKPEKFCFLALDELFNARLGNIPALLISALFFAISNC